LSTLSSGGPNATGMTGRDGNEAEKGEPQCRESQDRSELQLIFPWLPATD
jgi:hypothetical protein